MSWNDRVLSAIEKNTGRLLWSKPNTNQYSPPVFFGVILIFQDNASSDPVAGRLGC